MPSWPPSTNLRQPRMLTPPLPVAPLKVTQGIQTNISAYGWRTPTPQTLPMLSEPSNTKQHALKKTKKIAGGVTKTKRRMTSRQTSIKSPELIPDQGGVPPPKNILLSPRLMAQPSTPPTSSTTSKIRDAPLSAPLWGKEVKYTPLPFVLHPYQTRVCSSLAPSNVSSQEENHSPTP